jgi:hypothetical protein
MPPLPIIVDAVLFAVLPAAVTAAVLMAVVERLGGPKLAPLERFTVGKHTGEYNDNSW